MRSFRQLPLLRLRGAHSVFATALLTLAATGCVVSVPNVGPNGPNGPAGANRQPVISSFTFSPATGLTKDQPVTFQVVANDPEGQPLQMNWSATKGTLSGTSGQVVSWRAVKPDNSLDAGLATVSVIVSDGVQSTAATANIQVMDNGQVVVSGTTTGSPAPASAAPSASPTAAPTASPSAEATASPEASPSPSPSASASAQ